MNHSILIVEDEPHIARVLELELQHEGYETAVASDGTRALPLALARNWSLIMLDVMLPGISGLEVLEGYRSGGGESPVLMLTARDSTKEVVLGFELGANDYVTKPFATQELLVRIRNLIRLTSGKEEPGEVLTAADLTLNPGSRQVIRQESVIELTPTEFELLHYMMKHQGQVLSREQLIGDVWGYAHTGDTNIVDVYVRYLRLKIDKGFSPKLIRTIRGIGYSLSPPSP
ncbi:DNA-binding response regulator, OmpR family, contains REC and winged-helix (wHTH) domain [Paenibacillus sp. UNCCL117]|uniref:response regulator transcription factor n=1 Tax=unclassified Paenibacillus TaxID=185978 RepID=UPI000880898A|nr:MULTISPECIES: response regulator transcription factor [unclassified Paenibacillus]SDC53801.1 DNA-binding response regulator, OmpR family, contains REC and winged-helix (wHTH) domain [Paenibacillus sp. cl123]SFW11134.1 DNA-binding response regulator, OmpR family, contains REC and winged-helix (wHTH) domain [Paenibacillus sp. UNCCL117]